MNLKPGRYLCRVTAPTNGWFGEAGEKNTPFIRIPLVVTEGEFEGHEVVYQGWVSDRAVKNTIRNLREVFEWDGDVITLAKESSTGHFIGRACSIVTEEEEYEGKIRVVIKWLNSADGIGKMLDPNAASQLAQRLAKSISAPEARPRTGGYGRPADVLPAVKPKRYPDPELDGPDIPF